MSDDDKEKFVEFDFKKSAQEDQGDQSNDSSDMKSQDGSKKEQTKTQEQDKTVVINVKKKKVPEKVDKTVVLPSTLKYLEEKKKEEEKQKKEEEEKERLKKEEEANKIDLDNDATAFIDLNNISKSLVKEAKKEEKDLVKIEKEIEQEKKQKELIISKKENEKKSVTENVKKSKKTLDRKKFIMFAFVIALFIFFDEDEEKIPEVKLIDPIVNFPRQNEVVDKKKAAEFYQNGILEYKKGSYVSKLRASRFFLKSLENQFYKNPAIAEYIYTNSEVLINSQNKIRDANKIFKLLQVFKDKAFKDPELTSALAMFYLAIGKVQASINMVEKYSLRKGNKPTKRLYCVYLKSLIESGSLLKAKDVFEKLNKVGDKDILIYETLFDYHFFKSDFEKAFEIIKEGHLKFPGVVSLMIRMTQVLIKNQTYKLLEPLLLKIRMKASDSSRYFHSRYFEALAMLHVSQGNVKEATQSFKLALKTQESDELRIRLAQLSDSKDEDTSRLIRESKAMYNIIKAKIHLKKKNFKYAFSEALEATKVAPDFLEAKIFLSTLQIKQSFFNEAIDNLEELYKKYGQSKEVMFELIDAYIEAYKFSESKKMFTIISSQGDVTSDPRYFSAMAKYNIHRGDLSGSIIWLTRAINKNPLNDKNIYELAKIFITNRKYRKAKTLLANAMDLSPTNIDYKVSYSEILYEMQGVSTGLGYLYDLLKDYPDNSKLLGQVAKLYYKNRQLKMFQSTKRQIQELPKKDESLYSFMIEAAEIEGDKDDMIKNAKELLKIAPGRLEARIKLAELYIEKSMYKEALEELNKVKRRSSSFPKLLYFYSTLYIKTKNFDKALEQAEREVKENPESIDGHVLLGQIYSEQKDYIKAEKHFKKVQRIDRNNVDALVGLAVISDKKSQYEISLDLFKRAISLDPSRAENHRLIGDVYRKIGQSGLAVEAYDTYLKLYPGSEYRAKIQSYINMMR